MTLIVTGLLPWHDCRLAPARRSSRGVIMIAHHMFHHMFLHGPSDRENGAGTHFSHMLAL